MSRPTNRIASLDALRGWVMILMTLDHASFYYNAGRTARDSVMMWKIGTALPLDQLLTRWVTHLCAPTFVFLAGTAAALSAFRRTERGEAGSIDRDLFIRGALIIGIEILYIPYAFGVPVLQVLYAIGAGMILMIPLRRVPPKVLLAIAVAWFFVGEAVTGLVWVDPTKSAPFYAGLFVAPTFLPPTNVMYPLLPWTAIMMAGWAFGVWVNARSKDGASPIPIRQLIFIGLGCLAVFLVVRGLDGYGNMFLHREDNSLAHWLHVSKYPPSLSFFALELGVMTLALAGLSWAESWLCVGRYNPLLVFGQTALFFYVVHFMTLQLSGPSLLGWFERVGIQESVTAASVSLIVLFPVCIGFRALKRRFPKSPLRYI